MYQSCLRATTCAHGNRVILVPVVDQGMNCFRTLQRNDGSGELIAFGMHLQRKSTS
jgi:hypothetical protein